MGSEVSHQVSSAFEVGGVDGRALVGSSLAFGRRSHRQQAARARREGCDCRCRRCRQRSGGAWGAWVSLGSRECRTECVRRSSHRPGTLARTLQEMEDLAISLQTRLHPAMATWPRSLPEAGVSEATVSRVLNDKPGVSAVDAAGGARRARRARLRTPAPGCASAAPASSGWSCRSWRTRSSRRSPRSSRTRWHARRFTPVLCTQSPGGCQRGRVRRVAARPRGRRHHLRLGQHADTGADHQRYRTLVERGLPGRVHQRLRRRDRRPVHLDRRPRRHGHSRCRTWSQLGHRGSGWPSGRRASCPPSASAKAS